MTRHEFEAEILEAPRGGAWVEVPFDVKEAFGSARPKILATFDGHPYRGSIVRMGGAFVLGLRKDVRAAIAKQIGDSVRVTLEPDTAPRVVEVPADLRTALEAADVVAVFDKLSYTHRREYVEWVEEAKKAETRQRRIAKTVERLAG